MNYNFRGCNKHTSTDIINWINAQEDFAEEIPDVFWEDMRNQKENLSPDLLEIFYIYFPNEREVKENESSRPSLMPYEELKSRGEAAGRDILFSNRLVENEAFEKVPLALLDEYHDNIFTPQDDETYASLVESIRLNGVREPILILEKDNGRYEILAGHNRTRACKDLGYQDIKAIIFKDLTEEEAKGVYIESNLIRKDKSQRLPSELAKIYASYSDLKKVLGKRYDEIRSVLVSAQNNDSEWVRDRDIIAHEAGISSRSIANYIRLNNLEKHLLDKVDAKKISLVVGVELSFLRDKAQIWVNEILEEYDKIKINLKNAKSLRALEDNATYEDYKKVLLGKKALEQDEKTKEKKWMVKLNEDFLSNFFDEDEDEKIIKDTIKQALKNHFLKKQ